MNNGIEEITSEFHIHRRNLPHWQFGGSTYFITFRSAIGVLSEPAMIYVKEHIRGLSTKYYDLYFGVVMPDHVHLLIRPKEKEAQMWYSLQEIMKQIKGASAKRVNEILERNGALWQSEYFDRLIRNEEELIEKWQYMWNNPIKAGLANSSEKYKFYI